MSTTAPPNLKEKLLLLPPVRWGFYYKGEDGQTGTVHSYDGVPWSNISDGQFIDGMYLPVSHQKGYRLWLYPPSPDDEMLRIDPPELAPFFAFTRYAVPTVGAERWLYSCFGYILPDYLFYTKIFPGQPSRIIESRLLTRPASFPL